MPSHHSSESCHTKIFSHKIQFACFDTNTLLVPGTEFWVELTIVKEKNKITIQFPTINFQIVAGQPPIATPVVSGGYLYAVDGFLPEDIRPTDLVFRSYLAASNNGMSEPFSFTQDPSTLPVPPTGYIIQITTRGLIIIQAPGTFDNVIPLGPQILMPTDITYVRQPKLKLGKNYLIGPGFTNVTQFTNFDALLDAFRDSHVSDAFDNKLAWTWTSNSDQTDKTNNIMDTFVVVGKVDKKGTLKFHSPINLTNFTSANPASFSWDTAVAINRTNKRNIVISYGVINESASPRTAVPFRAVSFDGGKTWPSELNGPLNVLPSGTPSSFGDCRGVSADKFGNIWYSYTNQYDNAGNLVFTPSFLISSDGGVTFQLVYTAPPPINLGVDFYDYPQYCFGGDGQGQYGLWFYVNYLPAGIDDIPSMGFIPITGLGTFGSASFVMLNGLNNVITTVSLSASVEGRLWLEGTYGANYSPVEVIFKSPGPIDQNYAGPWSFEFTPTSYTTLISEPIFGYLTTAVQSCIYDDKRQALYVISGATLDYSQDMFIYLLISRNNGQTWSNPIQIATTEKGNRGFQSMALDPVTGNLIFGFYDGRNDPTFQAVQYFATVITASTLDKLVNEIPLSNPLYTLPSVAGSITSSIQKELTNPKLLERRKKLLERKQHILEDTP